MTALDLRDFLATGEFGGLTSSSERNDLRTLLGDPDDVGGISRNHPVPRIWRYGGVEFHFGTGSPSTLALLHFDHSNLPPAGTIGLTVEPWVLRSGLELDELSAACEREGIALGKVRDLGDGQEWWESGGGVILAFGEQGLEAVSRRYDVPVPGVAPGRDGVGQERDTG